MDFGQTAKPSPVAGAAVTARADIVATQGSVAVELPPEQTVQSAPAGDAVQVDVREDGRETARGQQRDAADSQQNAAKQQRAVDAPDEIERSILIEPLTRSVVLQEKNLATGETIQTVPDETTLKLRVYARALADRAQASAAHSVERSA